MSSTATTTAGLQNDDLGFRPAASPPQASTQSAADDGLGFRPASAPDDLGFRPAVPAQAPAKPEAKPLAQSPTPLAPKGPTFEAAPEPSFWERARSTVANSAIGHATEEALPKVADALNLHPTETVSNPDAAVHAHEIIAPGAAFPKPGVAKGVAEFAGGLATPENVELIAATGGLGALRGVLGEAGSAVVSRLVSAGFSAQMIAQAAQQYPKIRDALKSDDYDTAKQLMTEAGLGLAMAAGGLKHGATEPGQTPQERFPVTLDRSRAAAPEATVAGDTAPDYLTKVRQRIADRIAETEQQDRVAAEERPNTAPPPILSRPPARTPMEQLSADANEVRQQREFRQQLTQDIGDEIEKRLRDAGLLEAPKPDVQVVDRRAVKPEDVEPYQPPRTFIGGENIPASVVPRGKSVEKLLEAPKPPAPTQDDIDIGFRSADTTRMLPPASPGDLEKSRQEQQRYDEARDRARAYGQPQPRETVEPATAKDISADSRRVANLAIGRFANPVEQQYARDVWSSMIGQSRVPAPPYGMTRVRADDIRNGFAKISRGDIAGRAPDPRTVYEPDVLEEAKAMMDHTHDFLSNMERPGRYFADLGDETSLTGRGPKAPLTVITSMRGQFPWFANLKESPGDLANALRLGKGPGFDRLITAAADHIVRTRAETRQMARSVEPNLESLAEQVRAIDPELSSFLTDAARGNISTWTETRQQQLDTIERRIADARSAIEFGRAVEDLASEERAGGEAAAPEGEEETSAARGPESAGAREAGATEDREVSSQPTREGILPGLESAVAEHAHAAAADQGRRLTDESNRPAESIEGAAGKLERESPLFRGTKASPQNELFPPRDERGFATLDLLRDVLSGRLPKEAWHRLVAEPLIEKGLKIGDKYAAVRDADPDVAGGLHLLDNAPAYFRAKASQKVQSIIGSLSREQERQFTLLADADSRENLRANHADEYRRAMADPAIQDALRRYRPIEQQLTAARGRLDGKTLDQDYLRRVYDQHVAGIGQAQAPESSERATTAFDRVIQPQKIANLSREATAEYHYKNGLHEFGPAFGTKYIATNLRALEDQIARDFTSKATELKPGDFEPRSITYNGEKYYRPDLAREMRDAGEKNVKAYDRYDPTAGVKYPQQGASRFLGPQEVVRALNDYGAGKDAEPGAVRRFLQEQVIGFGFGIPHVANILRRVTLSAPLGAANPEAWARAWKVAFSSELRDRGVSGLDDPTFDKLLQQGSITTGENANLKEYWGGNFNPANWLRTLAGVGHKLIFDPKSFGGFGGIDQRARLSIADLVRSQNPRLTDEQIASAINTQLGDYNRANWSDRQKTLSKFMLFPGWNASSIRWVIEHPVKTTVPPALIVWTANQVLHQFGQNRREDASDFTDIHWGDRSIGVSLLRESMARNLARPLLNYAQSKVRGESDARAGAAAARGVTEGAAGMVSTLRPDLTAVADLATNRADVFTGRDLVTKEDRTTPGRVLPNRGLEKQAALVIRHAVPALDRLLGSDEAIDFRSFAGSSFGFPNYAEGAEQRLKRDVAESVDVSEQLRRFAKTDPDKARAYVQDPDNAAYALFRGELESMASTLKRIDEAKDVVSSARNLSSQEKAERLAPIAKARENLLRNADGLDTLLFERRQQNREKPSAPVLKR